MAMVPPCGPLPENTIPAVQMPELVPVLTQDEIQTKVAVLASRISADYEGKTLVLVGVLKGAFVFLADLMRHLTIPVEVDFIRASSYGKSDITSGEVEVHNDMQIDLKGKDVLIVEDIFDTGLTIGKIISRLALREPGSIRTCAFIDKHERRSGEYQPDYWCHSVDKGFLVGYGLDYSEQYRHLSVIYAFNKSINEEAK